MAQKLYSNRTEVFRFRETEGGMGLALIEAGERLLDRADEYDDTAVSIRVDDAEFTVVLPRKGPY